MNYKDIITIEPDKRGGKPCIRGLRITVYDVLDYLARMFHKSSKTSLKMVSIASASSKSYLVIFVDSYFHYYVCNLSVGRNRTQWPMSGQISSLPE